MLSITQLKRIQSLKLKKYRQKYAEFVIEGDKLITEALLGKVPIKLIAAEKNWMGLYQHAIPETVHTAIITPAQLQKITSLSTPQPAIAVVAYLDERPVPVKGWTLALDHISDPGNLGTIIRTADWFGIDTVFCSTDCVEKYNPKVIQATMGSLFRVNVIYGNIPELLRHSRQRKYAGTLNGKDSGILHGKEGGILLIGSESHGISPELLQLCDEEVTIMKKGKADSLNAAVAASILLYEAVH